MPRPDKVIKVSSAAVSDRNQNQIKHDGEAMALIEVKGHEYVIGFAWGWTGDERWACFTATPLKGGERLEVEWV